jgi:integrase
VSSFLTWLVQEAYLPSHPLQGMKRPHVDPARPAIYTASQVAKLLASASGYREGRHARALGLLFFAGLRPSEVPDATLDLGAPPTVKVQGGKMRGRANRIVRLSAGAAEWLATQPAPIIPPTIKARMALVERTGIQWIQDGARHTWISVRLTLSQDENGTAREAGTSPDILYRHYHALMTREQAKEMAALGLAETPENG